MKTIGYAQILPEDPSLPPADETWFVLVLKEDFDQYGNIGDCRECDDDVPEGFYRETEHMFAHDFATNEDAINALMIGGFVMREDLVPAFEPSVLDKKDHGFGF